MIYLLLNYNGIKTVCVGIDWKKTQRHKIITVLQAMVLWVNASDFISYNLLQFKRQ